MFFTRSLLAIAATLAVTACGGPADFSYGGLNYADDAFSGMPMTTSAQMPTSSSANATYFGRYTAANQLGAQGDGPASMYVDFASADVTLTLSGDLSGSLEGSIVGSQIVGDPGVSSFDGQFYGSGAEVAAGKINGIGATTGNTIEAAYIVAR